MAEKVLVIGGLGLVGRAVVREFEARGSEVIAVSRRAPDFATSAQWLSVDLTDRAACEAAFAPLRDVSRIVYCALYEKPQLIAGWRDPEQIATNARMLSNVLDFVLPSAHLALLQGTKAYAAHLRPMSLPGKESQPRPEGANFYWHQEDDVRSRAQRHGFAFSILRPQVVCGVSVGSPMNVVAAIGVYAALCRRLERPFRFPGGSDFVTEMVDADLLARAIAWTGDEPRASGQAYNVTNGDVVHWPSLWPHLADALAVQADDTPLQEPLSVAMPLLSDHWDALVADEGLVPHTLHGLVGSSWQFADAVLGYGGAGQSTLLSTVKIRQHGFAECLDTLEMFINHFRTMRELRWIP